MVGVYADGRGEVLGTACEPAETKASWLQFLRSLAALGLSGVRQAVSDAHLGLKSAIARFCKACQCRVNAPKKCRSNPTPGGSAQPARSALSR